jgi:hypothetical protein
VRFVEEADDRGLIEVALSGFSARPELNLGALRFRFTR